MNAIPRAAAAPTSRSRALPATTITIIMGCARPRSHRTNKSSRGFKQSVLHEGYPFSVPLDNVVSKETGVTSIARRRALESGR
jgi:hypothetical protein